MDGCLACDLAEGRPLGVGTLVVRPRRHGLHVWDMGADEPAERDAAPPPDAVEAAAARPGTSLAEHDDP